METHRPCVVKDGPQGANIFSADKHCPELFSTYQYVHKICPLVPDYSGGQTWEDEEFSKRQNTHIKLEKQHSLEFGEDDFFCYLALC